MRGPVVGECWLPGDGHSPGCVLASAHSRVFSLLIFLLLSLANIPLMQVISLAQPQTCHLSQGQFSF